MATILNNRSTIATDPIRNFRFLVTFLPQKVGVTTAANSVAAGSDWATALSGITFGFTSVSGMAVTTDSIPYREGGYNTTVHQIPGQTSFAPISLQRGVILGSSQNWGWMRELFQTVQGTTTRKTADNFRCDLEIQVLSHPAASNTTTTSGANGGADDHVAIRFKVYNAWITSLAYSDLNAGDNAIFVEQMSLVHEGFDVSFAKDLTASAAALA
jgi:phage tail-like protein